MSIFRRVQILLAVRKTDGEQTPQLDTFLPLAKESLSLTLTGVEFQKAEKEFDRDI